MLSTIDKSTWKKVKLDDAVIRKEENDKESAKNRFDRFLKVEHMDAESLHIKRWASQENGDELNPYFYKIFRKGQVLFPTRNPHLRRAALASFDGICGEKTLTLEPNQKLVTPEFIPLLFHSEPFYAHTTGAIIGSTNPHVRWRDVANFEFLLPPKDQQARLAKLVWAAGDVVESQNYLKEKLFQTRENVFINRLEEFKGKMIPLSDLLIPKNIKSHPPHERQKYIGLENIDSGSFSCDTFQDSSSVLAQCNVYNIGDLCYSKLRPYLDKAFIASFDGISTTELLIYDVQKGVDKEYILNHFHSKPFIEYVTNKGFGTKMPRVSNRIIGNYLVKELSENNQRILLKELRGIFGAIQDIEINLKNSKQLQKSLINQIF